MATVFGCAAVLFCAVGAAGVAGAQDKPPPTTNLSGRSLGSLFEAPSGKAHRASSTSNDPQGNLDFVPLASGAEVPIADLHGPGVINHIWLNVQSDDPYAGRLVVLRAKWDGETSPSVEVPVGDFFGVGFSLDGNVDTLPVRVTADGRARSCWWPMPFAESAHLSIRNDSQRPVRMLQWAVDWNEAACPKDVRTFHAQFRTTGRGASARAHKVVETRGRGHYVGTVLSIWSGEEGWPGEGDDRFYIDGADLPTLQGSGLEDYFGDSWGYHLGTGPFGGVTSFERSFTRGVPHRPSEEYVREKMEEVFFDARLVTPEWTFPVWKVSVPSGKLPGSWPKVPWLRSQASIYWGIVAV
jgi:hypothetical protein